MRKLGVKTSRYANTDLYTVNPIDAEGNGTIKLEGLNPTGEFEKLVKPMCTAETRLTDWDEIEAYFATCIEE